MKRVLTLAAMLSVITLAPGCGKKDAPPAEPAAETAKPDEAAPVEAAKPDEAAPVDEAAKPDEAAPVDEAAKPDEAAPVDANAPEGFAKYANEEGLFSVMAPGTPKVDQTTAESVLGPVVYKNVMFPLSDGALMVAWGDMPIESADAETQKSMFDGGRDGMIKSVKGTLINEKDITLDGRPGREWTIEVPGPPQIGKIINHVRTYLDGKRNYIIQAMHVAGASATRSEFFLGSFTFTGPKAE